MDWNMRLPSDWRPKILILALLGMAAGGTYFMKTLPAAEEARLVEPKKAAPNFALKDSDGKMHRLEDLRGKAVLLNFMATWCNPCAAELPLLVNFAKSHQNDPIVILAVDFDEPPNRVARYAKAQGLNYPVLIDEGGAVAAAYGVTGFPTTYFINVEGVVLGSHVGSYQGYQGNWMLRNQLDKYFGHDLAVARRQQKECTSPLPGAANSLKHDRDVDWALKSLACACGCDARLLDCDCGEPRGGREIREYFARIVADPDLSPHQARRVTVWKYKDEYAW